ncbi:hypothetical protein K503DRAFT_787233 [Rhizopogon vinicolor AM-OR11-026]|uniref:Uncharacterized protein n=1 Tax=Rhizopogon vinicolor AM-OR11-026 TaxID=1314800 RepID=A0A1B7MII6_9AGAM|nr:hypothetical protein K503DRAFT_787233 [Rhizopogon vinicolor AM-OR11-026]
MTILYVSWHAETASSVSVTDTGCMILYITSEWVSITINALLGVIMIARLRAMFHGSRKMLVFLVVILLVNVIYNAATTVVERYYMTAEEAVLSGTHQCGYNYDGTATLIAGGWILATVWEVIALSLAVWIAVEHFRGLPRGYTTTDCFAVLTRSHLFYFAAFAAVSCLSLGVLNPKIANSNSVGSDVYGGVLQASKMVQMFVLGPRLILSVREYNAKLKTNHDEGTAMTTIAFGERAQESSGGDIEHGVP